MRKMLNLRSGLGWPSSAFALEMKVNIILGLAAYLALSYSALAQEDEDPAEQDWKMRDTPALHEPSDMDFKDTKSKVYVGGVIGVGQARSTEGNGSTGLGYNIGAEVGYRKVSSSSMSQFILGAELFTGQLKFQQKDASDSEVTFSLPAGILAKVGHGYSISESVWGAFQVGAGITLASYSADTDLGDLEDTGLTGLVIDLGYDLGIEMGEGLDFLVGFNYRHFEIDVNDPELAGQTDKYDYKFIINQPGIRLGMRFKF